MKSGYVDINWVEAHHDRWAQQVKQDNAVLSAEEFARLQGMKYDPSDTVTERSQ